MRIKLKPEEHAKVDKAYLSTLSDDELLQVYVIAGMLWKVEGWPKWERPTKLARKKILLRMKDWGG